MLCMIVQHAPDFVYGRTKTGAWVRPFPIVDQGQNLACQGQYIVVGPHRCSVPWASCIVTRIIVESQFWYTCLAVPPYGALNLRL